MLDYKNSIFPYPEGHQFEYNDEYNEWRCPECGRIIKFENHTMEVIACGNQNAVHVGSTIKGLSIGNVEWRQDKT